jgi:hypothetical protein
MPAAPRTTRRDGSRTRRSWPRLAAGITNVDWIELRAEDITAELGQFRAVTFAQSFHWMDRARVARSAHGLVRPDGVVVHVHATTHEGIDTDDKLPHPRPPRRAIGDLIERFLGPGRRVQRADARVGSRRLACLRPAITSRPRGRKLPPGAPATA